MTASHLHPGQIVPMLAVGDVELSRDFYKDALGLRATGDFFSGGRMTWCSMAAGETELFLSLDQDPRPVEDRRARSKIVFYFYPNDLLALHKSLSSRGFRPSPMRVTVYGMREFTLTDPDGYQLWFGEATDERPTPREPGTGADIRLTDEDPEGAGRGT